MTNGQWELEELEAVLEPEEGTQRSVSCRWKHGGLGPMHTSTSKDKISIRQELLRVVACRAARLRLT